MVSKRKQKILKARHEKKMSKLHSYRTRETNLPDPQTAYGKRWWARRRGEGMSLRTHESPPWWTFSVLLPGSGFAAAEAARKRAELRALHYVEVSN